MKEHGTNTPLAVAVIAVSLLFLSSPETVSEATGRALSLCVTRVIPSVFPFSVLSSMFVAVGGARAVDRALSPVSRRLFGTERGASALFLGLLFGFPLGALTVGEEYRSGSLDRDEAARMLAFVCCASPTFPVYAVGVGCFGSAAVGLVIWAAQATVSVIIGLVTGVLLPKSPVQSAPQPKKESVPAAGALSLVTRAVTDGSRVILNVCGSVTFFSIASSVASEAVGRITDSVVPKLIISAVFEFSSGTSLAGAACEAGEIGRGAAIAIAAFSVGFAGLSVMFQTSSVCEGVPLLPYVCGKLITGLATAAAAYFVSSLPAFAPTFSDGEHFAERTYGAASLIVFMLLLLLTAVFYKKCCKNARDRL